MRAIEPSDLELLIATVREAGGIARAGFEGVQRTWEKSKGNPVTETDLAVDRYLKERLCSARPAYGWLSEETSDTPDRLSKDRVFVVDPIDGTLAFIKRKPEFTICVAVVEAGAPVSAVVFNPMTDELFSAVAGNGSQLNGKAIAVSKRVELAGCRMLVARDVIEHPAWFRPWPAMEMGKRASIAYRMTLVANGSYDGMMAFSSKYEWDTAAAALIVQEAGGVVSAHSGAALTYNQIVPSHRSVVCAGPVLHSAILERTGSISLP